MWSEIFKAIELLLKNVSVTSLDQLRRRSLLRLLIRIHLDLELLLLQGDRVIQQLSLGDECSLRIADLINQLKTIQSLFDQLNDSKVASIISIQLPSFAQLRNYWLDIKWTQLEELLFEGLVVDLSEISDSCAPRGPTTLIGTTNQSIERALLDLAETAKHPGMSWKQDKAVMRNWYLQLSRNDQLLRRKVIVRASFDDIAAAQELLNQIRIQNEKLREYLAKNFDLNDLIAGG